MKARTKKSAKASPAKARGSIGTVPTAGDESSRSPKADVAAIPSESPTGREGGAPKLNLIYNDLREWIAEADKLGEIEIVKGASWQEDIGMAAEIVMHSDAAPCVILRKIEL